MFRFITSPIRFFKRAMYRLAALTFGLVFRGIHPRHIQPFVRIFAYILPLSWVSAAWRRVLHATHFRFVACDWSQWAYDFRKAPHTTVALIQERNHGDAQANLAAIESRVAEAAEQGGSLRPVLVGPVTFLALAKDDGTAAEPIEPLDRLEELLPIYGEILAALKAAGAEAAGGDQWHRATAATV